MASIDGLLPEKGLVKGTNWWGAFVIGLAGTILVTGIAPYVVQGTGALGIILIGVMTIAGCFLCLCLAELGTMWPDRTGGIPGYATESFRPLVGDTVARHIGGTSGWAYWLGWFPVAPINVILTASYLAVLFKFSPGHLIAPVGHTWGAPIGVDRPAHLLRAAAGDLHPGLPRDPARRGLRDRARRAVHAADHGDDLPALLQAGLDPLGQRGRLPRATRGACQHDVRLRLVLPDPLERDRDGGRRLLRRGVPGRRPGREDRADGRGRLRDVHLHHDARSCSSPCSAWPLTSADPLTLYLSYTNHIFGPGSWEQWFVGIPLILALALSVLNAIMGVRPLAVPGGRGRAAAALVRAQEPARRARLRDGVQRGLLRAAGAARLAAADLHHLQRRLPAVVLARPRRLLRLPAAAPGRAAAVPAAHGREMGRARGLHHLDGHLLLRRLELTEDHPERPAPGTRALPPGSGDRRAVRTALLVAGLAGPQARGCWRGCPAQPAMAVAAAAPAGGEHPVGAGSADPVAGAEPSGEPPVIR